jgi:hypothetical protein
VNARPDPISGYKKDIKTINRHILNIFKEGELEEHTVISKNEITASDGKTYVAAFTI